MRSKKLAAPMVPTLILLLALPSPAWAWGRLGHRVIAKLAERHLSDRAKAESNTKTHIGTYISASSVSSLGSE